MEPEAAVRPPEDIPLSLERFARGESAHLAPFIGTVEEHENIGGTKVTSHVHTIKLDGNCRPRVGAFAQEAALYVLEYCIPRSEIAVARQEDAKSGLNKSVVRLHKRAANLFADVDKSGEGGELLVFIFSECVLKLPQLICKMDLKTSTGVHYQGADGLHVGSAGGKLALYWAESKVHKGVTAAITQCLKSVSKLLLGDGTTGSDEERDLQLLQRGVDFDDEDIDQALKNYLNPKNENFNKVEFRAICLVGFNNDCYPSDGQNKSMEEVHEEVKLSLQAWKSHIKKRIAEEKIHSFEMHFIILPFPDIDDFRTKFRRELGIGCP